MMELDPPRREQRVLRRCLCILLQPWGENPCQQVFTDPDSPLCGPCTEAGHEHMPHMPYAEVAARLRGEKS